MEKQWFRVAPGVTHVNGARVLPGQRLQLSKIEAEFDLGLGRIGPDRTLRKAGRGASGNGRD